MVGLFVRQTRIPWMTEASQFGGKLLARDGKEWQGTSLGSSEANIGQKPQNTLVSTIQIPSNSWKGRTPEKARVFFEYSVLFLTPPRRLQSPVCDPAARNEARNEALTCT